MLVDVASLASLSCFVIGIIIYFHLHASLHELGWLHFLDLTFSAIFGYVWFYFLQSVFSKALFFRKEMVIGPVRVMWLE